MQEQGFRTEIYLLRLDIIFSQKPFQADEFHGGKSGNIDVVLFHSRKKPCVASSVQPLCRKKPSERRSVLHTRRLRLTRKRVMYQIQKLNLLDPTQEDTTQQNTRPGPYSQLACQALDLLLSRLLADHPVSQALIEKVVVIRVWISSLSLQESDHPNKLQSVLDDVSNTNNEHLSVEATHASQSVSGSIRNIGTMISDSTFS